MSEEEELGCVSTRLFNILKNNGLPQFSYTIEELNLWLSDKTEHDLLRLPNLGHRTLIELKEIMSEAGYSWPCAKKATPSTLEHPQPAAAEQQASEPSER